MYTEHSALNVHMYVNLNEFSVRLAIVRMYHRAMLYLYIYMYIFMYFWYIPVRHWYSSHDVWLATIDIRIRDLGSRGPNMASTYILMYN